MTEHDTLFAIKLMVKSLNFSTTATQPLIKLIDELIESENHRCTDEYKERLISLNNLIDNTL